MLVQPSPVTPSPPATDDLARRMARPQRHRLLHGYPMAPLLQPCDPHVDPWRTLTLDPSRPLLVGVLPHTFCNPTVRGCGFCTFPHEKHNNDRARSVVASVVSELRGLDASFPEAKRRRVDALYFGGGTANLTPPDAFASLAAALSETFELAGAELSFEGAPRYFLTRDEALLDTFEAMPARHRRLSIGIQTFDAAWLEAMGRLAFGTEEHFAAVVRTAHRRGMTVSCDLLVNLPGQALEASIVDVRRAAQLGFDQICVYNLVLDPSIDSAWASSRSLLGRVYPPALAATRWLRVREVLLELGYVQTTLTNFERADIASTERRFVYERASFDASTYDALGVGPGAISTFTSPAQQRAIKWTNAATSTDYELALRTKRAATRSFAYDALDLRLLHVTRGFSRLWVDRHAYRTFFGTDVVDDFTDVVDAVGAADLVTVARGSLTLTPRGMFYADAVAGLFASRRAAALRKPNDAIAYAMG